MNLFHNSLNLPQQVQPLQNITKISAPLELIFSPAQPWINKSPIP